MHMVDFSCVHRYSRFTSCSSLLTVHFVFIVTHGSLRSDWSDHVSTFILHRHRYLDWSDRVSTFILLTVLFIHDPAPGKTKHHRRSQGLLIFRLRPLISEMTLDHPSLSTHLFSSNRLNRFYDLPVASPLQRSIPLMVICLAAYAFPVTLVCCSLSRDETD